MNNHVRLDHLRQGCRPLKTPSYFVSLAKMHKTINHNVSILIKLYEGN